MEKIKLIGGGYIERRSYNGVISEYICDYSSGIIKKAVSNGYCYYRMQEKGEAKLVLHDNMQDHTGCGASKEIRIYNTKTGPVEYASVQEVYSPTSKKIQTRCIFVQEKDGTSKSLESLFDASGMLIEQKAFKNGRQTANSEETKALWPLDEVNYILTDAQKQEESIKADLSKIRQKPRLSLISVIKKISPNSVFKKSPNKSTVIQQNQNTVHY